MKATAVILATLFTLQSGILFAGIDNAPAANETSAISFAPVTPSEATFEDATTISVIDLMPLTPAEATFDDMPVALPLIGNLSPATPSEVDFEDMVEVTVFDNGFLTPKTPAEADFE
jgi:hypothetical protein